MRERRTFLAATAAGLALFAVLAVLVKTGALDGPDARVVNLLADHRGQPFTGIAEFLDYLSTPWLLATIVVALVGGLWWSGRMLQAVYLAATIVVAVSVNPLLKLAFARQRPPDQAVETITDYSFPSGHTTTATAIAVALAVAFWPTRWRRPLVAGAVAFAVVMAVSRVYLAVHWPSDVLAGLALGFTIAMAVRAAMPWPSPEEAASARHHKAAAAGTPHDDGHRRQTIDVVFLDWGNTLMVDHGMREGPMKDWPVVEAEAGAREALQRLRTRYRLVVATNADDSPAHLVRLALTRVGLDDLIDDVVSSADVGDRKPNYAFFRAALLREGKGGVPLDPRRAVMVGDGTTNDVAGAQRAGMHTIWYNPNKRRFPAGAQPPDAVIRKLSQLPAAVDRLAGVEPARQPQRRRKVDADEVAAAAAAAARDLRAAAAAEDAAASAAAAIPVAAPASTENAPGETPADTGTAGRPAETPASSLEDG
jgi:undecaprenyl-diphosphatase